MLASQSDGKQRRNFRILSKNDGLFWLISDYGKNNQGRSRGKEKHTLSPNLFNTKLCVSLPNVKGGHENSITSQRCNVTCFLDAPDSFLAPVKERSFETMPRSSANHVFSPAPHIREIKEGTISPTVCQGQLFCFPKSNVFSSTNNVILSALKYGPPDW